MPNKWEVRLRIIDEDDGEYQLVYGPFVLSNIRVYLDGGTKSGNGPSVARDTLTAVADRLNRQKVFPSLKQESHRKTDTQIELINDHDYTTNHGDSKGSSNPNLPRNDQEDRPSPDSKRPR